MTNVREREFKKEFLFQTSRSGGAGGQHVNKVETRVELRFHVENSLLLSEAEKAMIGQKLGKRINKEGYLQLICQTSRSQLKNKEQCVERFYALLQQALSRPNTRTATRPTKASVQRRLVGKSKQAEKKANRSQRGEF